MMLLGCAGEGQWGCVHPWIPRRMRGHGHVRARRAHIGASGGRAWFGLYGQQSLLSCEAPAWLRVVVVVGGVGACDDGLREPLA